MKNWKTKKTNNQQSIETRLFINFATPMLYETTLNISLSNFQLANTSKLLYLYIFVYILTHRNIYAQFASSFRATFKKSVCLSSAVMLFVCKQCNRAWRGTPPFESPPLFHVFLLGAVDFFIYFLFLCRVCVLLWSSGYWNVVHPVCSDEAERFMLCREVNSDDGC